MTKPEVIDGAPTIDYNKVFVCWVKRWVKAKESEFKSSRIVVTSGPYRSDAVSANRNGNTLYLDFYSALRNGFGHLSAEDVEAIKAEWL